jgi:Uma2 family endonuclease
MRAQDRFHYITVEEYLSREERASMRHEYVDGRLFAMSGVTKRHNIITFNLQSTLQAHLNGSGCRAYASDLKVKVVAAHSFYYPDVVVSCGDTDQSDSFASNAVLIIEVLSRSTAAIDRREKVLAYKQIESLREYLIVHQSRQRVELHKKNERGLWIVLEFGAGDEITLDSLPTGSLRIHMNAIYKDVSWDHDLQVREDAAEAYDEGCSIDW